MTDHKQGGRFSGLWGLLRRSLAGEGVLTELEAWVNDANRQHEELLGKVAASCEEAERQRGLVLNRDSVLGAERRAYNGLAVERDRALADVAKRDAHAAELRAEIGLRAERVYHLEQQRKAWINKVRSLNEANRALRAQVHAPIVVRLDTVGALGVANRDTEDAATDRDEHMARADALQVERDALAVKVDRLTRIGAEQAARLGELEFKLAVLDDGR